MKSSNCFKVCEIFASIEGEGTRMGYPCTFVRLAGCNLSCSYCDTRYACENPEYVTYTQDEILNAVKDCGHSRVTLTGGEPLLHDVRGLIKLLDANGFHVNIETNGSQNIEEAFSYLEDIDRTNHMVTMDYKVPSSGQESKMLLENFDKLKPQDVVKFVVQSNEDLKTILDLYNKFSQLKSCNVVVSPIFQKIELPKLASFVQVCSKDYGLNNIRMQVQLHKIVWSPDERGV